MSNSEIDNSNNSNNPNPGERKAVPLSTVRLAFLEGLQKSAEETARTHKEFAEAILGRYDTQFKAIHSMVNSPGFQHMLENVRKTQESLQKMAQTVLPIVVEYNNKVQFAERILHNKEVLHLPSPQSERVIVKERIVEKVVMVREERSSAVPKLIFFVSFCGDSV